MGNRSYFLLNVYMPCDYRDQESLLSYKSTLLEISEIIESECTNEIIIIGDLNCDPQKGRFFKYFKEFNDNHNLSMADSRLPIDSFTYVSAAHKSSTSWLDHIVVLNNNIITNINIKYGDTIFDHIPLEFELIIPNVSVSLPDWQDDSDIVQEFVRWDKLTDFDVEMYKSDIAQSLANFVNESFLCTDLNCDSQIHMAKLDDAFLFVKNAIKTASNCLNIVNLNVKHRQIPGWNDHVKAKYEIARNKFLSWKINGKIRSGEIYEEMVAARSTFKKALDFCKRNELNIKKEKLALSFNIANKSKFWKDIKKLKNNTKNNDILNIDNHYNPHDIVNCFSDKYKSVLDDPRCKSALDICKHHFENSEDIIKHKFFVYHITDAINDLNTGIGWDGIHSNHFIYGGNALHTFLSRLFSAFMTHGYVPRELLIGEIRPIIKDQLGNKNDSSNYRPIMNSSNFLKIFENCMLYKLNKYLKINSRQFGFRKHTSCNSAISVLRETVTKYTTNGSNVHAAFLDLSKAFDKVNHSILVTKLLEANVPKVIVNLLINLFRNQNVYIVFNGVRSESWLIGNGVRQGGIISPILFNFYINDILKVISETNVGCSLCYYMLNIIGYADDLVLLVPTSRGLQILLDKLTDMLNDLCLILNVTKSACMIFRAKKFRRYSFTPCITISGTKLKIVNECKYLGTIITSDLLLSKDIERCTTSFLKQYHAIFRRFHFTHWHVLKYLFESHCMAFYGSEMWFNLKGSTKQFHDLEIYYHKAIKRMLNLPKTESNHYACEQAGLPILKHFINKKIVTFLFSVVNSKSPCLASLKYYYRHSSFLKNVVCKKFTDDYNIHNLMENDLDALKSRIHFVEMREIRSNYYGH